MKTVEINIFGRVQGVGYRRFAQQTANMVGIKGQVRNCPDGSVQVLAQGDDIAVSTFCQLLKQGPSWANVNTIKVQQINHAPSYKGFTIEH